MVLSVKVVVVPVVPRNVVEVVVVLVNVVVVVPARTALQIKQAPLAVTETSQKAGRLCGGR